MSVALTQWFWTLAAPATKPDSPGGPSSMILIFGLMLALLVFIMISGRGRKREQKTREKMLSELGRNDRVITIGGMIGVVTDVKDDEVTVKIDEASNTKIRMKKWAVRSLDSKESEPGGQKK